MGKIRDSSPDMLVDISHVLRDKRHRHRQGIAVILNGKLLRALSGEN